MHVISTTAELVHFFSRFSTSPRFVAVDTEFIRTRSYWPQLCLIQVAAEDWAMAIDPLAPGIDLSPLWAFLERPDILKVFHAARQDLEGIFFLTGKIFQPLFDTQVASMACALGEAISYENLVATLLGKNLDKTERVVDWSRRPLSEKQIRYALDDVIYLKEIYPMVSQSLKEWGRELWIQEEMTLLKDPQTYSPDFEKAWKKVKGGASLPGLTAKGFWFLGKLAAQREHLTSTHNIPRRHWLKDERICDLVLLFEKTPETLPQQPLPKEVKDCVEKILSESETISFADMPLPPGKRKALASELNTYGLLSTLLKECAARSAVAPKLIATREDLESLIWSYQKKKNPAPDTPLMVGWRYDLFGIHAMKLLKESLL